MRPLLLLVQSPAFCGLPWDTTDDDGSGFQWQFLESEDGGDNIILPAPYFLIPICTRVFLMQGMSMNADADVLQRLEVLCASDECRFP